MRIEILFRRPLRHWQSHLAVQLRAMGHRVRCVSGEMAAPIPTLVDAALAIERRIFGPVPSLFTRTAAPQRGDFDEDPDLVIALDGETSSASNILVPLFDGALEENDLLDVLARSPTPFIDVRARKRGVEYSLVRALLAVEHRDIFSRALDQVLARVVSLLLQAVRRWGKDAGPTDVILSEPEPPLHLEPWRFMARGLKRKIANRLLGVRQGPNHWRIGFRRTVGFEPIDERGWKHSRYVILPDDHGRFYADPVPFENGGRTYVFFEDFSYESRRGVIGVVEIGADGSASAPRTVLETSVHLSYPLILRHRGEIYMLPETSGAGCIRLFRADPFPDRWVPDRILVEGVVASDATPIQHQGTWWLFATLSDDGGSSWDRLGLFHAPDLFGPWQPHQDNPALVDAGAARPAGAMWHEGGTLIRVAQDCRRGYGAGLAICRVDRLDLSGFAQTLLRRFEPPPGYSADGIHTFNRTELLEVIDLRFPPLQGRQRRLSESGNSSRSGA